jgi:ribosomal protein S18 acetylase RimI-like enzyme
MSCCTDDGGDSPNISGCYMWRYTYRMARPNGVTLKHRDSNEAPHLLDAICHLYDAVFSQPPFRWTEDESEHHRQSLTDLMTNPTFGLVTAEAAGELVGFAYGVGLTRDTAWWSRMTEPLPEALTAEWDGRTFAVIDLAVQQGFRKRGIGRALLDTLLATRPEDRATLTVQPVAIDTKEFYDHLGWQQLGTTKAPAGAVAPFFDVYLLPLQTKPNDANRSSSV